MAVAKKAAKKSVTKKATKKRASKKPAHDGIYYVILERSPLFRWKAHSLYETRNEARSAEAILEATSGLSFNKYKVERVELVKS